MKRERYFLHDDDDDDDDSSINEDYAQKNRRLRMEMRGTISEKDRSEYLRNIKEYQSPWHIDPWKIERIEPWEMKKEGKQNQIPTGSQMMYRWRKLPTEEKLTEPMMSKNPYIRPPMEHALDRLLRIERAYNERLKKNEEKKSRERQKVIYYHKYGLLPRRMQYAKRNQTEGGQTAAERQRESRARLTEEQKEERKKKDRERKKAKKQ